MESLSDKLKSLGVQVGANQVARPQPRPSYSIETVIPGEIQTTRFGDTYLVETWYETGYQHGLIQFQQDLNLKILTEWGHTTHLADRRLGNFIFLDTETTGLGGGTGTFPFLIGLGHLHENGFHLLQLLMRNPTEEPAQLSLLNRYLEPFDCVVTYNGKSFDIPILNTRHTLNGLTSPFPTYAHLDLLPLARRVWRNRLPSRSLGNLEVDIIRVARTQEEVPGWMVPQIYFEYLQTGDARPLAGVLYHNAMDIVSLAALFQYISMLLSDPLGYTEPHSLDLIAIARLYEELGLYDEAIRLYEFSLNTEMPEVFFLQTLMRFAELYRKRGEVDKMVLLWQKAAARHHFDACVELAKYYEHSARDCSLAMHWTETAYQQVDLCFNGVYSRQKIKDELQHRRERLNRKLSTNPTDAR